MKVAPDRRRAARRRGRLPLLLVALAALLAGCAQAPREDVCRQILEALLPAEAAPQVTGVESDPVSHNGVVLRYRVKPTGPRLDEEHHLLCVFAPPSGDPARFGLISVEVDGKPLSRVKLILLHRWLGQEMPPQLLDQDAPHPRWPLGLHLAYLVQQVLNGLVVGSVIALVAVGYTLVYGVTRHIQFAYGELLAIGAFMTSLSYGALVMAGQAGLAAVVGLGLPFAMLIGGLGGYWIDRTVFRPMRGSDTQTALIAAIGLSIFLQEFLRLTQGGHGRWLPSLLPGKLPFFAAGGFAVSLTFSQVAVVLMAVALSLAQGWILHRTALGRSYRAAADDPRMSALLGVDVTRVVALTYAGGAALAAAAGAALMLHYGEAGAQMGVMFGFKALTAALLGGIGSFAGALVGGLVIGQVEALWAGYLDGAWRDAAVFAVLVLVLLFRPAGLFAPSDPLTSGGSYGGP
ncbi:MAG: branched-chain amino acid ABC transporter permease, partial [Alphaproteobacteria bacterium]|nr:branched-chain amino acid ABC transporter permease [Alphaproteobacteria bacterium]